MEDFRKRKPGKIERGILIAAGTLCVGLGVIGIVLPLLPTTPFLLLALALYARSSEKFYNKLLHSRWFGKYIRNYREGKGIPIRIKVLAISMKWTAILLSVIFLIDIAWVRVLLILIAAAVSIHIILIRKKDRGEKAEGNDGS